MEGLSFQLPPRPFLFHFQTVQVTQVLDDGFLSIVYHCDLIDLSLNVKYILNIPLNFTLRWVEVSIFVR